MDYITKLIVLNVSIAEIVLHNGRAKIVKPKIRDTTLVAATAESKASWLSVILQNSARYEVGILSIHTTRLLLYVTIDDLVLNEAE